MRAVVIMGLVWMIDLINVAYVGLFKHGNLSDTTMILQSCLNWIPWLNGLWLTIAIVGHRVDINEIKKTFLLRFSTFRRSFVEKNVNDYRVSFENNTEQDDTLLITTTQL